MASAMVIEAILGDFLEKSRIYTEELYHDQEDEETDLRVKERDNLTSIATDLINGIKPTIFLPDKVLYTADDEVEELQTTSTAGATSGVADSPGATTPPFADAKNKGLFVSPAPEGVTTKPSNADRLSNTDPADEDDDLDQEEESQYDELDQIEDVADTSNKAIKDGFGPGELLIGGKTIATHDWLGKERVAMTHKIHEARDFPERLPHQTRPSHPWQITGCAKFKVMLEGPLRGGICCDEMGLGKTMLAVLTGMECRERIRGCYNLIVATKSCVKEWLDETQDIFEEGHRPRVFILEHNKTTATELIAGDYDFVITTYGLVMHQHQLLEKWRMFVRMRAGEGESAARLAAKRFRWPTSKPVLSLFSNLYRLLGLPIRLLILDEIQMAKLFGGMRHNALKSLFYFALVGLTGTPMMNRWSDFFGILDLFPNEPLTSEAEYFRIFQTEEEYQFSNPTVDGRDRLIRYMQSTCFGRPASIREKPKLERYVVPFELDENEASLVVVFVEKFVNAATLSGDFSDQGSNALVHATNAQIAAGNIMLFRDHEKADIVAAKKAAKRLFTLFGIEVKKYRNPQYGKIAWAQLTNKQPRDDKRSGHYMELFTDWQKDEDARKRRPVLASKVRRAAQAAEESEQDTEVQTGNTAGGRASRAAARTRSPTGAQQEASAAGEETSNTSGAGASRAIRKKESQADTVEKGNNEVTTAPSSKISASKSLGKRKSRETPLDESDGDGNEADTNPKQSEPAADPPRQRKSRRQNTDQELEDTGVSIDTRTSRAIAANVDSSTEAAGAIPRTSRAKKYRKTGAHTNSNVQETEASDEAGSPPRASQSKRKRQDKGDVMDEDFDPVVGLPTESYEPHVGREDQDPENAVEGWYKYLPDGGKKKRRQEKLKKENPTKPAMDAAELKEWYDKVKGFHDNLLFSPRVDQTVTQIQIIWEKWPGEKILVWSRSLRMLDLVDEGLWRRTEHRVRSIRFDGTQSDSQRRHALSQLENTGSNAPMLITPGAGGAGLNITTASKCIFVDPWWNVHDVLQAEARIYRIGQTKPCHMFYIEAENSAIDVLMKNTQSKKKIVIDEFMQKVRRPDDQPPDIPEITRTHGVYKQYRRNEEE